MKKSLAQIIAVAAITGLALAARGGDDPDQSEFPQIASQPVDQNVSMGSNIVFTVQATNAESFQWLLNGVPIDGQTNSSLTLANVGTNDVGLYSCQVSKGAETVPTRGAALNVVTAISPDNVITVFGTPLLSGGSQGSCPGRYAGYVNYTKTVSQGWGWAPSSSPPHTATDGSGRMDTKVLYVGKNGDNGCAQTSVTIPHPPASTAYRFAIYFPNNVPTGPYPLVLSGFNP
jgi:Immunoglobulin domain